MPKMGTFFFYCPQRYIIWFPVTDTSCLLYYFSFFFLLAVVPVPVLLGRWPSSVKSSCTSSSPTETARPVAWSTTAISLPSRTWCTCCTLLYINPILLFISLIFLADWCCVNCYYVCFNRYLKSGFVIDLLGCFPWDNIYIQGVCMCLI